MLKVRKSILMTIFVAVVLSAVTTVVFAWLTNKNNLPFIEVNRGYIYTTNTFIYDDTPIIKDTNFAIKELAFVDFKKDVVDDEYGMLNQLAIFMLIKIQVPTGSMRVKNQLALQVTNTNGSAGGMLYMIINEGVLGGSSITDYKAFFLSANFRGGNLTGVTNVATWRTAINLHNTTTLSNISSQIMNPNETLTIQLVFWGDYDMLTNTLDKDRLLRQRTDRINFNVAMTLKSTQENGVF